MYYEATVCNICDRPVVAGTLLSRYIGNQKYVGHYECVNNVPETPTEGKYKLIGETIGKLVDEKNKAYGDSFNKSSEFLKILYPNGVNAEQYSDLLGIIRVFDKLMRIATDKDALGENPWNDIVGYGILRSEKNE